MALLGSQDGVVEDRWRTHPSVPGPARRPGWPQAERFEQAQGCRPCHTDQFVKADRSCPVLGFRVLA
jgi:hypothetical protein